MSNTSSASPLPPDAQARSDMLAKMLSQDKGEQPKHPRVRHEQSALHPFDDQHGQQDEVGEDVFPIGECDDTNDYMELAELSQLEWARYLKERSAQS